MVFLGSPTIITRNINLEKISTEFQIIYVSRFKFYVSLSGTEKTLKLHKCVCVCVHKL